jgi:tetratricopeptide (TPR) repeat protein
MSRTHPPLRVTLLAVAAGVALCACHRTSVYAREQAGAADATEPTEATAAMESGFAEQASAYDLNDGSTSSLAPSPLPLNPPVSTLSARTAQVDYASPAVDAVEPRHDTDCDANVLAAATPPGSLPETLPALPATPPAAPNRSLVIPHAAWLALLLIPAVALIVWRRRQRRPGPRPPTVVSWMPTLSGTQAEDDAPWHDSRWSDAQHAIPVTSERFDAMPPPLRVEHDLHAWPAQREREILASPATDFNMQQQPPCALVTTAPSLLLLPDVPGDTVDAIEAVEEVDMTPCADTGTSLDTVPCDAPTAPLQPAADEATGTAAHWARTGQRWWQQSQQGGTGAEEALERAADAFARAMALEPARADVLGAMLSRCHLAHARLVHGDARIDHLDAALRYQPSPPSDAEEPLNARLHRTEALYERALAASPGERAHWLALADSCLAALPGPPPGQDAEQAERLAMQLQMAHVELATGRRRDHLFDAAVGAMLNAVERSPDSQRDEWLALLITHQQRNLERLNGAARAAAAQRAKAVVAPWLHRAVSLEPLLAWLRFLAVWAEGTQGGVAADRYAEVEQMLDRAERLSPEVRAGTDFARACHLRLRARTEVGGKRLQLLREALRLLDGVQDPQIPQDLVALEAAQVHLAAAQVIGGDESASDLRLAMQFADTASLSPAHRPNALMCALDAHLRLARLSPATDEQRNALLVRASRLRTLDIPPASALGQLAEVELYCGHYAQACAACDSAWHAGASGDAVLSIWRDGLARWSETIRNDEYTAWQDAHKRLRSAATSHS